MKLEIDYDKKEIKFSGSRNIKSLIDDIKLILSDREEYKLVSKEREVKVTNIFEMGSNKVIEKIVPYIPPPTAQPLYPLPSICGIKTSEFDSNDTGYCGIIIY